MEMNFSMLFGIGQSKLGYLSLDILVSENLNLPSEVTKYPVEDGDEDITDHITAGNEEVTISGASLLAPHLELNLAHLLFQND